MNEDEKRVIKLGVLANAVFLVLLFFIQRIAGLIWNLVLTVGGHLHQGYVDRIYRGAALGDRNMVGHLTLLMLLGTTFFVTTYFAMKSNKVGTEALSPLVKDAIRYMDRITQGAFIVASITAVLLWAAILVMFSISSGTDEIASSFNQRLTVLAPAISDIEYKTLKSRWASMQSKSDYDALVSVMDNRAVELGVKLPPVRKP
jgi:hypothetical protein